MIRVCFFAELRERLECAQVELDNFHGYNVSEVLADVLGLYPHWQPILSEKKWLVAVNQAMATMQSPVNDNDEVAFFPPVTGG